MSEYKELIKNFNRIRDYMREFFVFGFKTRNDFNNKSVRTYDNERRRIESYLNTYIKWEYNKNGKNIFISVDSSRIKENPFFKAYKSKSFTKNDIILHFYILDILTSKDNLSLDEISNEINENCEIYFDPQTIRNKLKEYTEYGIINIQKEKKVHLYSLNKCYLEDLNISKEALIFFSETAPFGIIGSYLNDRIDNKNTIFQFKHNFIVNTLEDNILLSIINAIKEEKRIIIENLSYRDNNLSFFTVIPLYIYVSVQTGRRYLICENTGKRKFSAFRLDYIKEVKILEKEANYSIIKENIDKCLDYAFCTSLIKDREPEHFEMTLLINDDELYVLDRLKKESRNGKIEQIKENTYKFSIDTYDTNELTTWIKTFTGRIVNIKGNNKSIIGHFYSDIKKMKKLYGEQNG